MTPRLIFQPMVLADFVTGGNILTRELRDLGGERSVLRALRKLVDEGTLVRLGDRGLELVVDR